MLFSFDKIDGPKYFEISIHLKSAVSVFEGELLELGRKYLTSLHFYDLHTIISYVVFAELYQRVNEAASKGYLRSKIIENQQFYNCFLCIPFSLPQLEEFDARIERAKKL